VVNAKSQTLTVAGAATASNRVPFLPSSEGPKTNAHEHVKVELVKNAGLQGAVRAVDQVEISKFWTVTDDLPDTRRLRRQPMSVIANKLCYLQSILKLSLRMPIKNSNMMCCVIAKPPHGIQHQINSVPVILWRC
jgi:hypothetical protein